MAKINITSSSMITCTNCNNTGWVLEQHNSVESVSPCPECRNKDKANRLLANALIPPRYFDRGFQEYSWHSSRQKQAQLRAIDYVQNFPTGPRGLLFSGPPGVGKTHLSVAILKTLILEKIASGRFIDETEFLRRLQYSYGPDSRETEREVMMPLLEVDLLVWDDLGTGRPTEWVAETIRMIINHRYTYKKPMILSTNCPLEPGNEKKSRLQGIRNYSLAERIGRRLFSRIMEMSEIVKIDGPDFRTEIHKAGQDTLSN